MTKPTRNRVAWTAVEDQYIRENAGVNATVVAAALKRSKYAVYERRRLLKARDRDDNYVHVTGPTEIINTETREAVAPYTGPTHVLTDDMLRKFNLFEPVTGSIYAAENPSLWQRIKRLFKK